MSDNVSRLAVAAAEFGERIRLDATYTIEIDGWRWTGVAPSYVDPETGDGIFDLPQSDRPA